MIEADLADIETRVRARLELERANGTKVRKMLTTLFTAYPIRSRAGYFRPSVESEEPL